MKAQVLKLEQELDKSKALTKSLREDRDGWRRKVSMQLSCFNFTSIAYEKNGFLLFLPVVTLGL
jgi:hypothetical protein